MRTIFFTFMLISIIGCSNTHYADDFINKELEASLIQMNHFIENDNDRYLQEIKANLAEPKYASKVSIAIPKIKRVEQYSSTFLTSSGIIKDPLTPTTNTKLTLEAIKFIDSINNLNIFYNKKDFDKLSTSFLNFLDSVKVYHLLDIDLPSIKVELIRLTIINKLLIIVNKLYSTLYSGSMQGTCGYTKLDYIINQNKYVFKSGEILQINPFIGENYTFHSGTNVFINGKMIENKGDSYNPFYTFKIIGLPGVYKLPVKLKYTNIDGKIGFVEKEIEYIIKE